MKTNNTEPETDFYILQGSKKPLYKKPLLWLILAVVLLGLAITTYVLLYHHSQSDYPTSQPKADYDDYVTVNEFVESDSYNDYAVEQSAYDDVEEESISGEPVYRSEVLVNTKEVNGFSLRYYTLPEEDMILHVGPVDVNNRSISLAVRAADISAGEGEIVGTFVDNGELLSQGGSRKGYCAIIRGKVHIGAAESTSYMEEALNNYGYFFRQYPLVVEGMAIDNKLQGKSLRRALCEKEGQVLVVECANISLKDFANTLVEFGVKNAINLVGGDAYCFFRNANHTRYDFGNPERNKEPNLTYIIVGY